MTSKYKIPGNTIRSVWRNPIHFIAFGFGSGTLPKMPGTWGTIVAIPIYLLMSHLSLSAYIALTTLLILISFVICHITARDIGVHDHPGIVLDEIVGYLLTMILVPTGWFWVITGFIFFRIFDIWKPFPIRWVDSKIKGGVGIVVDDLLAGVYAWIVLQLIALLFFQW
ncbi:MAG: phosphatidylglycerophosphatase [Gammaproteobacteria bacterium]|jgi:phosphatidylglycerophosphatase A|nr:phosphatidylglycerophosphatase [Gammaproteobacteria bacterium]